MARILVTNDDGIHSEGLQKLAAALETIGEVFVVAPAHEMSAASHSLTLNRPLRLEQIDSHHYTVDGTPTDCVVLALKKVLDDQYPDLVVSGINFGANVGDDTTYSGTVAGALEASIYGIPAIAISLASLRDPQVQRQVFKFGPAAEFAAFAAKKVLDEGLPKGTLLNINVPPGPVKGALVTRQGSKNVVSTLVEGFDPRKKSYYWIGEDVSTWKLEEGTDCKAISQGLVSITPLRNDLTDYAAMKAIMGWHGVDHRRE